MQEKGLKSAIEVQLRDTGPVNKQFTMGRNERVTDQKVSKEEGTGGSLMFRETRRGPISARHAESVTCMGRARES